MMPGLKGWVDSPDGRGTFDIIWACAFTTFLCSWTVLCMHLPGPNDSRWRVFRRKLYLTALGIVGPEFVFQIALGQYLSARRSVKDFHNSGYVDWTMRHAFFADAGGFVLYSRDWTPFPVDAKQLHYLIHHEHVDYPVVSKKVLDDKDKMDGLVRVITVLQTLWFVATAVGRMIQHLALTAFELTTLSFVICTIGTVYCWAEKPSDAMSPIPILSKTSIAQILLEAGDSAQHPYSRTPLDFASRQEWIWSRLWSNWINCLRGLGMTFGPRIRPIQRMANDDFLIINGWALPVLFLFQVTYAAILIAGWNLWFPTYVEKVFWRVATVAMIGGICSYWIVETTVYRILPWLKEHLLYPRPSQIIHHDLESRGAKRWLADSHVAGVVHRCAERVRNNTVQRHPSTALPLRVLLPVYVIAFVYCTSRAYVLLADIIELRELPASAFETVNWSQILPHF